MFFWNRRKDLEEKAKQGVQFLDMTFSGWENKVSPTLDMGSSDECIVAQVTGLMFIAGISELGISHPEQLGFLIKRRRFQSDLSFEYEYSILTTFFKKARMERLHASERIKEKEEMARLMAEVSASIEDEQQKRKTSLFLF